MMKINLSKLLNYILDCFSEKKNEVNHEKYNEEKKQCY